MQDSQYPEKFLFVCFEGRGEVGSFCQKQKKLTRDSGTGKVFLSICWKQGGPNFYQKQKQNLIMLD